MKFWKNWPYWVGGLIIGTIVGFLLMSYSNHCASNMIAKYPYDDFADLRCPWIITNGPGFLLYLGLYQIPGVGKIIYNLRNFDLLVENIMTILGWSIVGLGIGSIVSFIKSRQKKIIS